MIITFDPIIQDKVWGTEEWLLTEENVPNNIPKSLWELIKVEAWGTKNPDRNKFPLALKVIDAKENLSLQVHPDKNELWYVLEAKGDAEIMAGTLALSRWEDPGLVVACMNKMIANQNYSIQLQQGCIHALGGGCKVLEMADCLGTTYRLHDWDRTDREIHWEQAMGCLQTHLRPELMELPSPSQRSWPIDWPGSANAMMRMHRSGANAESFPIMPLKLRKWAPGMLYVPNGETFRYHYVVDGQVECEGQSFEKGQGFLVTASHRKGYMLNGEAEVLTVSFI